MEKGRSGLCERDSESGWEKREGVLCVCVCFGLLVLIFKIFLNLIFLMWTIFKVFIEFVTILLVLCFGFLAMRHVGIESPTPALEG